MTRRSGTRAVRRRRKAPTLVPERITTLACANPVKIAVMSLFGQLAEQGLARFTAPADGIVEIMLLSGEVFHLDEISVTRVG
jgi:hypothetical protein